MFIDAKKQTNKKKAGRWLWGEKEEEEEETGFAVARTVKWHLVGYEVWAFHAGRSWSRRDAEGMVPVSANHSHLPAQMRWDEWQFYAILQTLMQSVLQKKWWCVRKRFSSNFLNDKIVIVILIGLWLSQAGSMDTISWMIKMYLFFHLYTFLLKICLSFIGHFAEVYASYESSRAKMYLIPTGPQSLKVVKDTLLIRFCHQNIHLKFHESFSGFFFFFSFMFESSLNLVHVD